MSFFLKFRTLPLVAFLFFPALLSAQSSLPPGSSDPGQPSAQSEPKPGPLGEAETAIESKDWDKARNLLDPYLSAHPSDARALFDRGYCDDAQGHDDTAVTFYRKAVAADPQLFEAHLALGLALAGKNTEEARKELETAVQLNPEPPNPPAKAQAYRTLAEMLHASDPDAAKADLIEALKLSPETTADTLLTAEIATAEDDQAIAEQAYRRVLAVDPQSGPAIAGLAHILMQQKKYTEAEPLVHSALLRDPEDPALNAQYAALLSAEGKTPEAIAALEKLHTLEPKDSHIGSMLADAYVQSGDLDKADAVYAQALTDSPNDPELLSARGQVLIREQKYPEALAVLQHAATMNSKDADTWSGIAFAASKTGQPALELDALAARSKITAETPATYFLWATAHDKLHHNQQAAEYYQLFLNSALGKFPDEEWQAKQRLAVLKK